jgi:hypothetical protein
MRLFSAYKLNADLARARSRVELDQHDLLPGSDQQTASFEGDREGRSEHRRTDMARSIVIAPSQMMLVLAVLRRELLPHPIQIRDGARLELNRRDTCC